MAAVLTRADVWADRRRRVTQLRGRYGHARQLLDFFGALLGVQEGAFHDATSSAVGPSHVAAYTAEIVAPAVIDVSVALGPERMRSEMIERLGKRDAREMIEAWMLGGDQPPVERFLARAALGPVLEALPEARGACQLARDALHCPDCGGPPQLSYIGPGPEDLAGGRRYLLCARCSSTWGFPRMRCPGCGEEMSSRLPIFGELGTTSGERGSVVRGLSRAPGPSGAVFPHARIEACETCRRYLLGFDLGEDPDTVPVVDEIGALPLDLVARDKGFSKITPNLMGF